MKQLANDNLYRRGRRNFLAQPCEAFCRTLLGWIAFLPLSGLLVKCGVAGDPILPTPALSVITRSIPEIPDEIKESATVLCETPGSSIADQLAARCQTGTLLFSRGDCMAVRIYTGSRYTHVATIVFNDGIPWAYDSTSGTGVRKLSLDEFLKLQAPDALTLCHPVRPLSEEEKVVFQQRLDRELGRQYSVTHFIRGQRGVGLHCAEYLTDALMSIDWVHAENPAQVSPGSLLAGVTGSGVHVMGEEIIVPHRLEPIPETTNWRESLWRETKSCYEGGCRQMSRWVLCR
ncbi:hypothetical protein SH661x_003262 [Planctomicrobium sp. SH661]|uniref:hypothetical protein n=1 Tax=Planctomicrobium sp. SH661 TaxID=3448124 RepID=UPI003F5C6F77